MTGGPRPLVVTTQPELPGYPEVVGIVHASVEGVEDEAVAAALAELRKRAEELGAGALVALQCVQSQFQWNARTTLLATAVGAGGKQGPEVSERPVPAQGPPETR